MTKTDLSRYVRCPYSWWLLDSGRITFEETVDEFQAALVASGDFQDQVEAAAAPLEVASGELKRLLRHETRILGTTTFEDRRLRIKGRARRYGVRPQVCGCRVCSTVRRGEVMASVSAARHLTLIHGVGRARPTALQACGYPTWESLVDADPTQVWADLVGDGWPNPGLAHVGLWQLHARSYQLAASVVAEGARFPLGRRFVAVDLEFIPERPHIWLVGATVVDGDRRRQLSVWADTPDEELARLEGAGGTAGRPPALPGGHLERRRRRPPQPLGAARRHGASDLLDPLAATTSTCTAGRNATCASLIPGLGLKDIGGYFGHPAATRSPTASRPCCSTSGTRPPTTLVSGPGWPTTTATTSTTTSRWPGNCGPSPTWATTAARSWSAEAPGRPSLCRPTNQQGTRTIRLLPGARLARQYARSMGNGTQRPGDSETNAYSAAPAALGYLAQVEYALLLVLRRLDVELEFDVSIETLDDIVFHGGNDAVGLFQTKHRVELPWI